MANTTRRLVTGATTNLTLLSTAPTMNLTGMEAVNTAAYAIFVKFYWFSQVGAATSPTVGTTAPDMTINIPTLSSLTRLFPQYGLTRNGDLWVAVTKVATDADTTVTVAGDGLITFFLG